MPANADNLVPSRFHHIEHIEHFARPWGQAALPVTGQPQIVSKEA
jgi:hypothetical protein